MEQLHVFYFVDKVPHKQCSIQNRLKLMHAVKETQAKKKKKGQLCNPELEKEKDKKESRMW